MSAVSAAAQEFLEANKVSPVIYGAVLDQETGGAHYQLKNGQSFKLSAEECRQIGMPDWGI